MRVIFKGRHKAGRLDLESVEMAVRSAMHRAGAAALTELLQFPAPAADRRVIPCPCGHQAHYRGLRSKPVLTAVKAVERTAEAVGEDIAAREQQQIQRAVPLDLPMVMGEPVPILYVELDGTGVPVVNKETVGRQGKTEGQPAHTREAKLGCVFTQTAWDKEGYAIRDPDSTTYVGAIETAEEFGKRLYLEAWKRGWSRAAQKVVLGDGAKWIRDLAAQHFPGATQIVDLYHARQHLFVGSGVVEAGCKTVIGSRCEQSGMFWTVRGANAILALRCCQFNGHFEDYWEARRTA